ncbi:DoxX family protein [Aquimarina gracilis]|uniref:DoxX family protein n=1 Tax=Aquimarina gracilis TaxID=874422 RepID=A0ABU5ZUT0_9FLAO|nr:DoxX family protein [Aquimarina gracilis]MEB3345561.1 DoxX family protein [Aquimarina gracilis]
MKLLSKYEIPDIVLLDYFLRFSIALGFLSAVLDRFGFWPESVSAWGNWENFVNYTGVLNPWFPSVLIPFIAILATVTEVIFSLCLLIGYKKALAAKASGVLLLMFAAAMIINTGVKGVFDYSVFIASAAAFSLSWLSKSISNE